MPGNCPKCGEQMIYATIEPIELRAGTTSKLKGIIFKCPSCSVVLGVDLDPLALRSEMVNGIVKGLAKQ